MQARLLLLGCALALALGCDAAGPNPLPAEDLLPDLGMARLADIALDSPPDGRVLIRYSTTIVNVGAGRFELHGQRGAPLDSLMTVVHRVHNDTAGWRDTVTDAVMHFGGDGHGHWHVRDLEESELRTLAGGDSVARSVKRGFCFWDNVPYRLALPGAPATPVYRSSGCGTAGSLTNAMGLSIGWGDIYAAWLPDQYVDITGLADGLYRLVVTADPANWFVEASDTNNVTWADLQVSGNGTQLAVLGYGPSAVIARR